MKPMPVTFYVYADDESQVAHLQSVLHDFVANQYGQGRLVTATKMSAALSRYGNNLFVNQFFK